jgi:hypothetical protein
VRTGEEPGREESFVAIRHRSRLCVVPGSAPIEIGWECVHGARHTDAATVSVVPPAEKVMQFLLALSRCTRTSVVLVLKVGHRHFGGHDWHAVGNGAMRRVRGCGAYSGHVQCPRLALEEALSECLLLAVA